MRKEPLVNTASVIAAFESLESDDIRTYEPMQRKQRRPEPRRKGHGSSGGGFHCRRNKSHTWGSGAGARLADLRAFAGAIVVALVAMASSAVAGPFDIGFKEVLNPGNAAAPQSGLGAVAYNFQIATNETTNSQYAYFLNNSAAGKSNTNGVWAALMNSNNGGIIQNGTAGNYTYSVKSGYENRPVVAVNWFSAARFVNWYVNGGTNTSSTETGSYTLNNATSGAIVARNAGAKIWIPSADEWTKAAFYDAKTASYKVYPTNSNAAPTATQNTNLAVQPNVHTPNTANFSQSPLNGVTMPVASYANTTSTYGAFDMLGNAKEWTDTGSASSAYMMGASYAVSDLTRWTSDYATPSQNMVLSDNLSQTIGFRVAAVPEPSNVIAAAMGLGGLIAVHLVKRRKLALARVAG